MESSSPFIALPIFRSYTPDLFQCGHSLERFLHAHRAQSFHSFGDRLVLNDRGRGALDDEPADGLTDRKRFDQRGATEITAALTTIAAAAVMKHGAFCFGEPDFLDNFRFRNKFFLTISADAPNESLRASHQDRARNQKWLDAHVVQTRDRAGSVVR